LPRATGILEIRHATPVIRHGIRAIKHEITVIKHGIQGTIPATGHNHIHGTMLLKVRAMRRDPIRVSIVAVPVIVP
jgi:hypothetical protein